MRVMRCLRSFARTTGTAAVLSVGGFTGDAAFAQGAPSPSPSPSVSPSPSASPWGVLVQCLDGIAESEIAEPGRAEDQRCSRQASATCDAEPTPTGKAACERALACGFLADGRDLAQRSGNRGERPGTFLRDWGKISGRCARLGAEADDCRQATVRDWWISARGGARLAGVSLSGLSLSDLGAEVLQCSLE